MKNKKGYLSSITALSFSFMIILQGCGQISTATNLPTAQLGTAMGTQTYNTISLTRQADQTQTGQLELRWKSAKTGFSTLAVVADIHSLRITLSGDPISQINQGQPMTLNLAFGQGGQTIRNIPRGTLQVRAQALNAAGQEIGAAEANQVQITPETVAQVNLAMQLTDTVVTEQVTNTGDLGLNVAIQDGNQVMLTQEVAPQGGYAVLEPAGGGAYPPPPPPPSGAPLPPSGDLQSPPPPPPSGEPVPASSGAPVPPPPPPSGTPTGDFSSCPKPPLPPPDVMSRIETENPTLAQAVKDLFQLSFLEIHTGMVELAAEYPQYFVPPPPLPADGSCPPPPPPPGTQPPPPPPGS